MSCYDDAMRCGAIRDDDERLACFDRELAGRGSKGGSAEAASRPEQSDTGMPPDNRRSTPSAPELQDSPAPASAPAPEVLAEDDFGRSKQEPEQISASIVGTFDGWEGRERFELSNGQVWEVRRANSSRSYSPVTAPQVVIRKNMFGFYVMDVPEVNATVPVTRVD
ncbi:MAG: hypothetical protein U5O39_04025 [Gammaproteobacteria bacterium]|nr:hypothetical protein [Gammaproteobacteria bacterium]